MFHGKYKKQIPKYLSCKEKLIIKILFGTHTFRRNVKNVSN